MKIVREKVSKKALYIYSDVDDVEVTAQGLTSVDVTALDIRPGTHEIVLDAVEPEFWVAGALAFDGVWSVVDQAAYDYAVNQLRENLKQEVSDYRYQLEVNHPFLDSSRESRTLLFGVETDAKEDPSHVEDFKNSDGEWVSMTAPEIIAMTQVLRAWVRSCFRREMEIHKALDQASTPAEIFAVDRFSNWPTGEM